MGVLSNFSGKKVVSIFLKFGYYLHHQTGSHIILKHQWRPILSVPNHKEIAPFLLRDLIKKSRLSIQEFLSKK